MISYICEVTVRATTKSGKSLFAVTACPVFNDKSIRIPVGSPVHYEPRPFCDGISTPLLTLLKGWCPDWTFQISTSVLPSSSASYSNCSPQALCQDIISLLISELDNYGTKSEYVPF